MTQKLFAKGVKIDAIQTKYGEIIKCGINVNEFCDGNLMNDKGWINFDIKRGRESGKLYAEINTYKQNFEGNNDAQDEEIVQFDDEEIPF